MATTDLTTTNGLITAGTNLIGQNMLTNANVSANNNLAQQQLALGQQAANAAQFRPVGITSRFGTSGFQYDQAGNVIGAGYQVAPDVAAMREGLLGYAGQNLTNAYDAQALQTSADTGATSLFNLGTKYVAQDPATVASNWMKQQQQLLNPGREQQLAQLQNQQFQQGRGGLAVGATNAGYTTGPGAQGLAATNPQLAAYYNAMAQQDAQLAGQAQQQGQQQVTFGQGLMSGGLNLANQGYGLQSAALAPYSTALAGASATEALGQNAFDLSTALGAKQATAGAQVADILNSANKQASTAMTGATNAQLTNNTAMASNLVDPVTKLLQSWAGGGTVSGPTSSVSTWAPDSQGF